MTMHHQIMKNDRSIKVTPPPEKKRQKHFFFFLVVRDKLKRKVFNHHNFFIIIINAHERNICRHQDICPKWNEWGGCGKAGRCPAYESLNSRCPKMTKNFFFLWLNGWEGFRRKGGGVCTDIFRPNAESNKVLKKKKCIGWGGVEFDFLIQTPPPPLQHWKILLTDEKQCLWILKKKVESGFFH